MGRFRKNEFQSDDLNSDAQYDLAYKRVKKIKGFYTHTLVYVLVNAFILISSYNRSQIGNEIFWQWQTLNTVFFWGIGLVAHGLSVFGRNIFFGRNWEENKIKELIEKEKSEKWE
jgi:pheromone shutdown protein TraB